MHVIALEESGQCAALSGRQHVAGSWRWLTTLLVLLASTAAMASPLTVHVAPEGKDANDGSSPDRSVATLQRALQLAARSTDPEGAKVSVAPGLYERQRIVVRLSSGTKPQRIVVERGGPGAAVFDGVSNEGSWLRVLAANAVELPLTISGITVRRYGTAVSLEGKTQAGEDGGLSGIRIMNNSFEDIGRFFDPPSTAALRMINIRRSTISGNTFLRVRNAKDCSLLHPIYLAHGSRGNLIENNAFDGNCGVAIKLRDGSNDNVIRGNDFRNQTLPSVLQDWYCDSTKRKDCSRPDECPSWNNSFIGNRLNNASVGADRIDIRHGERIHPRCEAPATGMRVITNRDKNRNNKSSTRSSQ